MLTVEHAAVAAGVSVNTIWRAVRGGKLERYRRGPQDTRFLSSDIERFKERRLQRRKAV
jgi:excisionase family DNA binding protein